MSTTAIVVSHNGQMHVVDLMNVNTSNVRQANILTSLTKLEIAPTGQAIAIADAECQVQLYGSPSNTFFTSLNNPIEQPDMEVAPPSVDWSTESPLNTVGMPYYRELLLSAWPDHMVSDVGAQHPKVDAQLFPSWKNTE
jgi:PAB-dependent poly(A)-specific ribonuclease subunit 2